MAVMLDIIGSAIIVGMLMLIIMSININVSAENYKGLTEFNIQTQAIQLARIFEFDFYKMGYNVPKPGVIAIADTSRIKFYTNLFNNPGERDSVEYNLGGYVAWSQNPRDRTVYRYENTTKVYINFSVTRFRFKYFNANHGVMATPVTGSFRDSIKSVQILLQLESPQPFDTTHIGGSSYASAFYQKLIYPRNL